MKNFKYFIYTILLIFILSIQAFAIMGIKAPGPSVDSGDPTMASKAKETQTVNPVKITNQPGRLKIYSTANTNGWGLLGPATATTNTYLIPTEESANSGETIITGVPYAATVNGEPATIIPFTWGTVASGGSSSIAINGSTITDPNFVNATEINIINNSGNISSSINNGSINISKLSAASVLNTSEMTSETVTDLDDTTVMTAGAVYSLIAQILGLPDIVISSPVNNGWVSNSSIITGTASDTGGTISLIEWKLETGGTYATTGVTGTTNWNISGINFGTDGVHNLYTRVTDNEGNTKESHIVVNSDNIGPVVGVITPSSLTHDGTGPTLTATVASITEINENYRQWSLYDVTDSVIKVGWTTFTGLSISGISIPADQHTYRVDVRAYDLVGNIGTSSSANITYVAIGGTIETLRPDSTVTVGNFTASTTTLHGDSSDQLDTTYIQTTTYNTACYVGIANTNLSAGKSINSVTIKWRIRNTTSANLPSIRWYGSTGHMETVSSITAEFVEYSLVMTTNPETSAAWTSSQINNMSIGLGTPNAANTTQAAEGWVEVDYVP